MQQLILKFIVSAICGFIIGIEREKSNKAAGLRTSMLICWSMTLFMILNEKLSLFFPGNSDILRLPACAVMSIGFLGTGVIYHTKKHAEGVTTACVLLVLVGIGLLTGIEEYSLALVSSIFTFGILKLKHIERLFQ